MRFLKQEGAITLEMWYFDDHTRRVGQKSQLEFSISGTYDAVCLPFWRALRDLQKLYTEKEFEQHWRSPFPTRELALLTQKLGKA